MMIVHGILARFKKLQKYIKKNLIFLRLFRLLEAVKRKSNVLIAIETRLEFVLHSREHLYNIQ